MATKSRGHIAWSKDGAFEFYEVRGEVYRAPISNVFDLDTKRGQLGRNRQGVRFRASREGEPMKPCHYCGAPDEGSHETLVASLTERGSICPACSSDPVMLSCVRCHRTYDSSITVSLNECPACEVEPLELIEPGVCDADFYKEP